MPPPLPPWGSVSESLSVSGPLGRMRERRRVLCGSRWRSCVCGFGFGAPISNHPVCQART